MDTLFGHGKPPVAANSSCDQRTRSVRFQSTARIALFQRTRLLTDRITIAMAVCEIQTQYNHIIIIVTSTKSLFQFPYTVICGLCVGSSCASPLLLELRLSGIVMKGPQAEPLVRIVSACMVMKQLDCSVAIFSSRSGHSPMSSALCWLKASIWRGCEGTL